MEYTQAVSGIERSLEAIGDRYGKSLSTALWEFDRRQLAAQLEGIRSQRHVSYVGVTSEGETVMELGVKAPKGAIARDIALVYAGNQRRMPVGTLTVQASREGAAREIVERTLKMSLLYALMIFLVALFIFRRFQQQVSRHLADAAAFLQSTGIEDLGRPLYLDKAWRGDEIDILTDALNTMRSSLRESYQRMHDARQEAQASEQRYRELVENARSMILKIDKNGRILEFNEYASEVLGYKPEEVLGRHVLDTIVPRTDKAGGNLGARIEGILADPGLESSSENENIRKDGSLLVVAWNNKPFFDASGEFQGVISVGVDVTERKRAEEALRENRQVLETILNSVPQSIFWKDRNSVYLGCNKSFAQAAGLKDPGQIVGMTDFELPWLPEETEGYRADDRQVMEGGEPKRNIVEQQMQSDGKRIWVETSKLPLIDAQGRVSGVVGIYEDITERKTAVEALRESEDRLESVLEGSQLGFWDWDMETGRVYRNEMWARILGYTLDEVRTNVGQWTELIHPEDRELALKSIQDHLAGRTPMHRVEYRMRAKDGGYRWILDQARVVKYDAQGKALRMSGTHTDVTEHRKMQELMIQTEKMMSVGGLAAGMAHEINNPLSAILQSAQVVLSLFSSERKANHAAAEQAGCSLDSIRAYAEKRQILVFLEGIREAGIRAARIVSNMLEFSRKSESKRAPVDINALLDKTVELAFSDYDLKKKYDFRKIRIERQYAQDLPQVPCTRTEIEQVVLNLLKNAAQALTELPQRDARSTISLRTSLDGDFLRIVVEDNGPGMPEQVRKRVFEPFFTTKGVGEGTGLGLSVSYFIVVTNHKGAIEVQSEPGKGTRFTVSLPLR
nr:PAS domain S-box protein [Fundidesulfovibrio soli]